MIMKSINEEKLNMWKKKLLKLEGEYKDILVKRGEAIAMGDLRENAAFQMLDEDASTYRVRMDEVKSIIFKLEKGGE